MQFEVEQKHRIENVAKLISCLTSRGVKFDKTVEQVDQYFAHPTRNFAKTDEALRIRTTAGRNVITYKGPKLDAVTKTRRELELPLPDGSDGNRFAELLQALGFTPVATVRKSRQPFHIQHDEHKVEGAIDDVENVGSFVELELLADDANLNEAQRAITALAAELDLGAPERRSYLEMLLEKRSQGGN